jgi:hypothetical protein
MEEGGGLGRWRRVGDGAGNAARGGDFTAAGERLPALRFRSLGRGLARESGGRSNLLSKGVPVAVVSARLGHANPSITNKIYNHALPADDKRAADEWEEIHRPGSVTPRFSCARVTWGDMEAIRKSRKPLRNQADTW